MFPDLHAQFPNLRNPEEAAYVAMALKVLPQGLMGVMICGMLAASRDLPLNYFAGIAVRNVYIRFIRPAATDDQQFWVGRVTTGGFMLLCVLIPNPLRGRLAFLFIGGACFLLGIWMERIGRRKTQAAAGLEG